MARLAPHRRGVTLLALLLGLFLGPSSCSYRPARFADRQVTKTAGDERAIAMPRARTYLAELQQADAYVRRELVRGLDPRRHPSAGDINALDEVVDSSWFRAGFTLDDGITIYDAASPPEPPFTSLDDAAASGHEDARVFRDRRGVRYERLDDDRAHPLMRTAAAAIGSRLIHALGYRTPPVWIAEDAKGQRFAATRWPLGVDLGPTSASGRRRDDPNDVLDHVDRRSLRALPIVTAWLDIARIEPRMLRDAYVGKPRRGHVHHYIVGLDGALGVGRYEAAVAFARNPDREKKNFFLRMFSMGLSPKPPPYLPETRWPSVGLISARVSPDSYHPSPPFEPLDRTNPADRYWLAKRLQSLSRATIAHAVQAGKLPAAAQNWLFQILLLRRQQVVEAAMREVTACEALGIEPSGKSHLLQLRDRSVKHGAEDSRAYDVEVLDAEGRRIDERHMTTDARDFGVSLGPEILARGYVVVRITRHGRPRGVEVHIIQGKRGPRIRGVRH
jgi:hypothetical protein